MLKSLNCPNCSAPYNPANLTCPFCGSYILNSDADEADYQKETFVQQEQRPANYKGIYLYGRLLDADEFPIRTGMAGWCKSALSAVGGRLALTNKRFLFCAEGLNSALASMMGSEANVDVFLKDVERLSQRTVALVSKRLIVETKDGKTFEFTVYNIAQWLEKGNRALAGEFGSLEVSAPAPQAGSAGPAPSGSYVAELKQLKELLDAGIITEEEFKIKKRQVLHI